MAQQLKVSDFLKDFRGSVDEFRTLLNLLGQGRADQTVYGTSEAQQALYRAIRGGIVSIHPTRAQDSISDTDLGEYLYINSRFFRTARNQEPQTNYWDEWEV